MRYLAFVPLFILLGCSGATEATSGTGTDTATATDTDTGTSTDGSTSAASTASTSGSTSGGASDSGGKPCIPGMSIGCACPDGGMGAQVCNADGTAYGPCECAGSSATTTTTDPTTTTTTTDPTTTTTTTDPTTTTGDPTTTGGMGGACNMDVQIEMMPDEATLSGDWQLGMSMLGEGQIVQIANPNQGTDGSVLFEPMIPCDDTWYIWVRVLDQGQNDSYFATLDGEPNPPAIFEGDCTQAGNSYKWKVLNWRDPGDDPCQYVEDPWAPTWTAGVHQIEFSYREVQAMGRILITNDPNFTP